MRIYCAHKYCGNKENIDLCSEKIKKLQKDNPNDCYISPLHNWSYLEYNAIPKMQFMELCYDLLEVCDKVIVLSNVTLGVSLEIALARKLHIPIEYLE